MSDAVASAIDRATFDGMLEAVGGDRRFVAELIEAFATDVPVQARAMRSALRAGDAGTVTRGAHTLKSSASSLGALTLADRCALLEAEARSGDLDGAAESIAAIERLAAEATAELGRLTAAA